MINHHPTAPNGTLSHLSSYSPSTFPPTSAILCRNTAPLITFAYNLLTRKIPCHVLGREIGQGLISLIDKLNANGIDQLEEKLRAYESRETAKAYARSDEAAAAAVEDRCHCIRIFCNQLSESDRTVVALKRTITALFSDDKTGPQRVTLSTVHKSKGLEYHTVFILDRSLMPSKWAKSDWQQKQERNLIYVAVTRAKLDLRYINSGCWQKTEVAGEPKPLQPWEQD